MRTLIWVQNEDIKNKVVDIVGNNINSTIFMSEEKDTSFRTLRKKMKQTDSNRIIKFENQFDSFEVYLKSNNIWTKIKFENLVSLWVEKNNYGASNVEWNTPEHFRSGKKKINLTFPLKFEEIELKNELLNFILEEDTFAGFNKEKDNKIINSLQTQKFKIVKQEYFNDFKALLTKGEVKELKCKGHEIIDDNKIILNVQHGKIYISFDGEFIEYSTSISNKKHSDLHYEEKAYTNNVKSLMNKEMRIVGGSRKIKTKDIVYLILSLITIAALLYITFNFIFTPSNSKTAFEIMFNRVTWAHPWIYLLIFNFIISIFLGLILSVVIQWFTPGSAKVNYKHALNMWVSLQVRAAATFITGNSFFGTFIWGLYVVKTTRTRTIGFAGMVASISVVRGIIMIPIGALFMIRGTIYNSNILYQMGYHDQFIAYTTLSWIGWVWNIIHNLSLAILIVLPPLHTIFNKGQEVYYGKKMSISSMADKMTSFEMQIRSLRASIPNALGNTKRLLRIVLLILIGVIIETFEFTYSLRMVEDYVSVNLTSWGIDKARYLNVFAISSIRYMAGFIHHVPLINIIPGQGMGITDFVLNDNTKAIITMKHEELSADQITQISEQSTLIIRFFNFYLKKIISLLITTVFVAKILIFKKSKQ